jgi:hypothetical protein
MRKLKSGIILKDSIFVPVAHDSHSQMLEELKISDTEANPNFVKAELVPPAGDVFADIETWAFIVDQDHIPDWFVAEHEEKSCKMKNERSTINGKEH